MGLFPLLYTLNTNGGTNKVSIEMTKQLQAINLEFRNATDGDECSFFLQSLLSWVVGTTGGARPRASSGSSLFLLNLSVEPLRCDAFFPLYDGSVTNSFCNYFDVDRLSQNLTAFESDHILLLCEVWRSTNSTSSVAELAALANLRTGAISVQAEASDGLLITKYGTVSTAFRVTATFNHTYSIEPA